MKKLVVAVCAVVTLGLGAMALNSHAESWINWRYAVAYHQYDKVKDILAAGQDINAQNDEGWTALHVAAEDGNAQMVRLLLENGARTDLKTKRGRTAYDVAQGYSDVQALLLAAGKPVQGKPAQAAPLKTAPVKPAPAKVGAAQADGICARLAAMTINDGRTAQDRPRLTARDAIWYNHPEELTALLDDCVAVDSKDSSGLTLLHTAANRDRVEMAKILLAHGASKTIADKDGKNAAAYATSDAMKALLGPAHTVKLTGDAKLKTECEQKYRADVALCSDSTCRLRSQRKWQQCLKTGQYW